MVTYLMEVVWNNNVTLLTLCNELELRIKSISENVHFNEKINFMIKN